MQDTQSTMARFIELDDELLVILPVDVVDDKLVRLSLIDLACLPVGF
jgi:hypothetical protein